MSPLQLQPVVLTAANIVVVVYMMAALALAPSGAAAADVTLQFYLLQVEKWDSQGMSSQFKASFVSGLAAYCSQRLATCGLSTAADYNFTSADVYYSPGYPKNSNSRYMDLAVYVTYTLRTGRTVNLTIADLTSITEAQRTDIYNRIGYYIVYIGANFYTLPPPSLANWVVIPISIIFTVVLTIVALVLSCQRQAKGAVKPATVGEDNQATAGVDMVQPVAASSSRLATGKSRQLELKSTDQPASPTAAVLLPGATNEGFDQSTNEKELRQRRTDATEEMALTDANEFGAT